MQRIVELPARLEPESVVPDEGLCAGAPAVEPDLAFYEALHFEAVQVDPRRTGPDRPSAIHVECVEATALVGYQTAWADLCTRALEPNIFLEPAFALPLLQHVRYPKRPEIILVWEENGPASFGRLIGLFPTFLRQGPISLHGIARGFAHKQTSCGTPLIDRNRAADTLEAVLSWLRERGGGIDALTFTGLVKGGPFDAEIRRFCAATSRAIVDLDTHARAVLRARENGDGSAVLFASAKRRKERMRQYRRLSEVGRRTYTSARTPAEIIAAAEHFLALEHNGWKGARGTALLADPTLATFTRTMTRLMAHEGKCRIDSIEIDGAPVAMGIVIKAGDRAYFWKTAFDEAYASLSPGVQFAIELTHAQLSDPALTLTDSCAVADHPMIDRLWPERMLVTDIILAVDPVDTKSFLRSVRIERLRRAARHWAKSAWLQLQRLKKEARIPMFQHQAPRAEGKAPRVAGNRRCFGNGWRTTGSGSTNGCGTHGW